MPAQGRRDALKDLLRAVASSRPWSLLASSHLARRIRHSLSARIALAITVAALVILLLGAGALLPEETARAIHLISS